jgi:hypothetical protein
VVFYHKREIEMATSARPGGTVLHLQVIDHAGEFAWRWRLVNDRREELATDTVESAAAELESAGVLDLYRRLWLVDTDPVWRSESERAILEPIGDFVGARLLGCIAAELLSRAPTAVRLEVRQALSTC